MFLILMGADPPDDLEVMLFCAKFLFLALQIALPAFKFIRVHSSDVSQFVFNIFTLSRYLSLPTKRSPFLLSGMSSMLHALVRYSARYSSIELACCNDSSLLWAQRVYSVGTNFVSKAVTKSCRVVGDEG